MLNSLAALFTGAGGGGSSFESIQTLTGNGSANSLSFTSIPQTFKHLQIRYIARSTVNNFEALTAQFNGVGGTSYTRHRLNGDGSSASAGGTANAASLRIDDHYAGLLNTSYMVGIIDILDYSSTTKNKTMRGFTGFDKNSAGEGVVGLISGVFMNTAAVTQIDLATGTAFGTNTSFALYGMKG